MTMADCSTTSPAPSATSVTVREPLDTGIGLLAGAAGLRGTLLPAAANGGFSLRLSADGLLLRATSKAVTGLPAAAAEVNRLRLGLEGSYALAVGAGALLTPSFEVGVRHDGGNAETGVGMDVGAGLSYSHPGLGLAAGLRGHTLVLHANATPAEWGASAWLTWDPNPASELGPFAYGEPVARGAGRRWRRCPVEPGHAGEAGPPTPGHSGGRPHRREVRLRTPPGGRHRDAVGRNRPVGGWAGVPARLPVPGRPAGGGRGANRTRGKSPRTRVSTAAPEHTLALRSTVRW